MNRPLFRNLGIILLGIYLILVGIAILFHVQIEPVILGVIALAAGVLILLGK